jgi:hypothetical protein
MANAEKILQDIVDSASALVSHMEIYWVLSSEALKDLPDRKSFRPEINRHSDYFRVARDAHYNAVFLYLGQLFDKSRSNSSIGTFLALAKDRFKKEEYERYCQDHKELAVKVKPLLTVRNTTIAHVDAKKTEKEVFRSINVTWDEIQNIVVGCAALVMALQDVKGSSYRGIPSHRRLSRAAFGLLFSLRNEKR